MDFTFLLGLLAGLLTTTAFVPQVLRTWRTKSANDLSTGMFVVFCSGVTLWLIYGILTRDFPVIIANAVTLMLALTILAMKFKYR
ncbi:SemiSWEET transporter [Oculatella sp. FACHB-28]|uniref:SemiSWEET transporter n=1 Tax=Cyanophyceae TaxID=3028117 RepID=UPI0016841FB3|nr:MULTISPECIES: SemiSWEET transporter [Cyanophyceae]MBD1869553.1 SemiSWEET transporter [Cyanobacteria bacterium FACHB-471]MBD1997148.1 SemiSWEET transporter [Leptolyngbya sp. FACHB-541]MBD2055822.1 SemiSWEET transporter [Oculatella sp. FACHB-28]MBD2070210.1 SemiSWEET transporter [Leptolyngbya sp. FACHB-671]